MTLNRRHLLVAIAAAPLAAALPGIVSAAEPATFAVDGIAIRGTDPVAYFTKGAPTPGNADHAADWNGATWHFASADNRAMFLSDPEKYAPKYVGYCAYAASKGYVAPTVPEAWQIVDGRLYLNFSLRARDLWREDIPGNIAKADANWPGILG